MLYCVPVITDVYHKMSPSDCFWMTNIFESNFTVGYFYSFTILGFSTVDVLGSTEPSVDLQECRKLTRQKVSFGLTDCSPKIRLGAKRC